MRKAFFLLIALFMFTLSAFGQENGQQFNKMAKSVNAELSVCDYIVQYANNGELDKILIPPSSLSDQEQLPEEIADAARWGSAEKYKIDINNDGNLENVYITHEGTLAIFSLRNKKVQSIPIKFNIKSNIIEYDEDQEFRRKLGVVQYQGKVYLLEWIDNCLDTLFFINSQNQGIPICWFGQREKPESGQATNGAKTCLTNFVLSPVEIIRKMAGDENVWDYAISQPGTSTVDILIKGGEDINKTPYSTPLMIALKNKRIDIMEMLLKAGVDPNVEAKEEYFGWPIAVAAEKNMLEAVKLLFQYGAKKDNAACDNALMHAIHNESLAMINFLLDNGVSLTDARVIDIKRGAHNKVLKALLARGAIDINRIYTDDMVLEKTPNVLSGGSSDPTQKMLSGTLMELSIGTYDIETLLILKEEMAKQGNYNLAFVMPGENVGALSQAEWSWRYWEWVKSFPKGQEPADDQTGSICIQNQSGPVFMLTGSSHGKPIKRLGEVPTGKYFLLPVLVNLAEETETYNCERLKHTVLNKIPNNEDSIYVEIDGKKIINMKSFRQPIGCYLVDTYSGDQTFAASDGYWIMVRPLAPGKHTIHFGGRFADGFSQDILYELTVK